MFLSDFAIKRPIATIVLIIAMMLMGLLALSKLRVNQDPDIDIPFIIVNVPYPGASPDTVEREVVNRIEKSFLSIPGVTKIESDSNEGSASFFIEFGFDKNLIEASDEVRNAIAAVRYKLPTEMREPILQRADPSAQPVIQLALSSSTQSPAEISRLAEDEIADRIRSIDGVSIVNVGGALKRELSVLLRAAKLREYNVSVGEVVLALRNQNTNAPVGKIRGTLDEKSIRLVGRIESPEEFQQIVVKRRGDEIVRLAQVAEIKDSFADVNNLSIRSGKPNVGISVSRSREASTVSVANKVKDLVKAMEEAKELQPGTKLEVIDDAGDRAQKSLNNVIESLIFGAVLTIFVVYAFLNSWRSTLITALSLPTSVVAAFIAVWLCGFTLNFMTLLGLSLAIGVLIDDAIVVRENIVRHMEELGSDRRTAALNGTAEIGMAVAATTFSIIAVFIPVAFMPGISGEYFRPFALTVTCSVLVSLVISFTLDPMMSAYWGDPIGHHKAPKKGLSLFLQRFNHWFDQQANRYSKVIAWALHHRIWMGLLAAATFVGAIAFQVIKGDSEFVPKTDSGALMITVRTPASSSVEYARLKIETAAAMAREIKEVKETNSRVDASGGRVRIDIGKKNTRKRSAKEIAIELREKINTLVGAEYVVLDDLNNGSRKPIQIEFTGPDSRKLLEIANAFMVKLRDVPGAVDVGLSEQDPKNELQIELDRGLANSMGISVNDAAQSLRVAFAGVEVGDWVDPTGESRDVAVRLHPDDRVNAENIERLPIAVTGTSEMVPLDQIAKITMGKGPSGIEHKDGNRTIAVSANAQGRSAGEVTKDAMKLADTFDFPPGYGRELGGQGKNQNDLMFNMVVALFAGILLMYMILVIQFGSFTAPVAVMISLPLSLIGVVAALKLTSQSLNLMSMIGILMLMGLVAKNAILLLDAARRREADGFDRETALMDAGRMRLRPILMTTFALIAGMLPVALGLGEGGEFYRPLAIAIIGGTITSTILTLLVVPTFYDSIEIARDRMVAKFHWRASRYNGFLAFLVTFVEFFLALLLLRFTYRNFMKLVRVLMRRPQVPVPETRPLAA